MNTPPELNSTQAVYVYFDYKGIKVSELLIPNEKISFTDLISENAGKYNIPKETFLELVLKNKINLSENDNISDSHTNGNNLKLSESHTHRKAKANPNSTRTDVSSNNNYSSNLYNNNTAPNTADKSKNGKEEIYKEILSYEKHEIPKHKLLDLTSQLLSNTTKYVKNQENFNSLLIKDKLKKEKENKTNVLVSPKAIQNISNFNARNKILLSTELLNANTIKNAESSKLYSSKNKIINNSSINHTNYTINNKDLNNKKIHKLENIILGK